MQDFVFNDLQLLFSLPPDIEDSPRTAWEVLTHRAGWSLCPIVTRASTPKLRVKTFFRYVKATSYYVHGKSESAMCNAVGSSALSASNQDSIP